MTDESAADPGGVGPGLGSDELTPETLVDAVRSGFSARNRERVSRDEIARIVAGLQLDEERQVSRPPALRVRRLKFSGEKRLRGQPPEPFIYDQAFAPGVNVIYVPDNQVGKSSVLKTIKYALTGDSGDYDADVRSWIADIWLAFALDKREFTILLSNRAGKPRALLVPGEEFRPIETAAEDVTLAIFDVSGVEEIREELQRFFFQRLGLGRLSWTQMDPSAPRGVAERSTSWLTYFQALQIPGGGDSYLLCDPQHAIGNQEGLIFSAFLGLNLVEPLNQLGVEAARVRKEARVEERRTQEQIQQAKERIEQLEAELEGVRRRLGQINSAQAARRAAVEGGEPARRLLNAQSALAERTSEQTHLETARDEINQTLQRRRARERQLREMIVLQLHFTGLEVSLCPNCYAPVDVAAVDREQTSHLCRLCGKPALGASPSEAEALEAEVEGVKREIEDAVRDRDGITARLATVRHEVDALTVEIDGL